MIMLDNYVIYMDGKLIWQSYLEACWPHDFHALNCLLNDVERPEYSCVEIAEQEVFVEML